MAVEEDEFLDLASKAGSFAHLVQDRYKSGKLGEDFFSNVDALTQQVNEWTYFEMANDTALKVKFFRAQQFRREQEAEVRQATKLAGQMDARGAVTGAVENILEVSKLMDVLDVLRTEDTQVMVLFGSPGEGKTCMARHLALFNLFNHSKIGWTAARDRHKVVDGAFLLSCRKDELSDDLGYSGLPRQVQGKPKKLQIQADDATAEQTIFYTRTARCFDYFG